MPCYDPSTSALISLAPQCTAKEMEECIQAYVIKTYLAWLLLLTPLAAQAAPALRTIETPNATLRLDAESGDLVGAGLEEAGAPDHRRTTLGRELPPLAPEARLRSRLFQQPRTEGQPYRTDRGWCGFHYDSLRREGEELPVAVRCPIRAAGSQVQFSIEVDNPTDRPLAEVFYGILGGLKGIQDRLETQSLVPGVTRNMAPALFRRFQAGSQGGGNLGIRYDAAGYAYPGSMAMGWMDVYNPKAGLGYYYANQDPDTRLTALYFEMRPFTKSAVVGDNWPGPEMYRKANRSASPWAG